ncbi:MULTISPECIES: hypothetical protein [unclassified Bradyrhizobium]|uniref:hypothetical protein n=1 Tax=unclassified Bradyrhizobium TaxID=2631580 RepID=UPI0024789667|nr:MULTISPECIES: hypothetical protein [unclassified Bradyrhizobium]WGR71490.1 hypothetical protein MTX24_00530 [Bradyrhizobium sp. ISRA426]WGR76325.1 hypothetical protein MTX21_25480 [Bradyrhizobium sp. ISRA430]WGR86730.1 hypothetical protein MTX25_00530 [Bradyrhizobium sp. ISRA432]
MKQRWIIVAAILVTALLVQIPIVLNADLGWLLTANEKILDGRKLGVDLFESNPPLSVYMYMPAAMLARETGVAPEFIVIILVIIEIVGVLFVIDRAAAAANLGVRERDVSTWSLALLLAILPGAVFGQREHIAVIALTPFVAITAIRWRDLDPGPVAILAGLGAGLAMCIKPFFVLVAGLPIVLRVIRQRSLRPLFTSEAFTAAATTISYGAILVAIFPAYLLVYAPMVAEAYLPIRQELLSLIPIPIAVIGASVVFLRLVAPESFKMWSDATPWLAASVGGAATFLVQGKGWPYTAFALCLFAMAAPLLHLCTKTLRPPIVLAGVAVLAFIGLYLSSPAPGFPPLERSVQALVKHPRLLTITDHIGLGHPLVRQLDGSWVGSSCAQLLAGGAILREQTSHPTQDEQAKLDGIIHFERRQLLADLRNGRPDVILVDTYLLSMFRFDWLAWANLDPEVQMELRHYREVETIGRVRIFVDQPVLDRS